MAFDRSRVYGLDGVQEKWIARRITFKEYALLGGERTLEFFGTPDVAPGAVVWVVSMKGEIQTQFLDQDPLTFDNITVVLDAVSGSTLQIETFYEDYETGLRIPNSFDPTTPCQDIDRGVLEKIFRSTCPYPDDRVSEAK